MKVYTEPSGSGKQEKPEAALRLVEVAGGGASLQAVNPYTGERLCDLIRFSAKGTELHSHATCINNTEYALPKGLRLDDRGRLIVKLSVSGVY